MEKEERKYDPSKGFARSGEVVDLVKKQLWLNDKVLAIPRIWEKEIGSLGKEAVLAGVGKNTLFVEVSSSAHFQEVTMRKRDLMNKINQHFGREKLIKYIKIKIKTEK